MIEPSERIVYLIQVMPNKGMGRAGRNQWWGLRMYSREIESYHPDRQKKQPTYRSFRHVFESLNGLKERFMGERLWWVKKPPKNIKSSARLRAAHQRKWGFEIKKMFSGKQADFCRNLRWDYSASSKSTGRAEGGGIFFPESEDFPESFFGFRLNTGNTIPNRITRIINNSQKPIMREI